ncbi:MAG: GNAT family N-acetyltransferase [Eubacterium sp.]|nr:GNAT family N-acetyltransferase [Eubacterium sp.]
MIYSKIIPWHSQEYQSALELRQAVLRAPLGLSLYDEDLSKEKAYYHLGLFQDDRLIAILLLIPKDKTTLQMRQVAVAENFQNKGIGRRLLAFAEKFAKTQGFNHIVLNARQSAVPFYKKQGYHTVSEPFTELGIPHLSMEKMLDIYI